MFGTNVIDYGYPAGTFKLGQNVYYVKDNIHRFWFCKKCNYCNSTGYIFLKGMQFECPACKGKKDYKEIVEKVIEDEPYKVGSIMSLRNKDSELEIYATSKDGMGLMIQKQNDRTNRFFGSKEEAKETCDKYNKEYNVYMYLKEYNCREIEESM